jgi:bifunctional non-homologous end joining protein LigD
MEEIAAGKGRRPKPFMLAGKAAAADAVWHSNRNGKANKASFRKTIEQPKTKASPRKKRVEDASVRRAPVMQTSEPASCWC